MGTVLSPDWGCLDMPHRRLLDTLAEVIHEQWRATLAASGATNANDVPFDALSAEMRESNRAAARRISEVLAVAGLDTDEGVASAEEEATARATIELRVEALADAEHRHWTAERWENGWRYGPVRDDALKVHNCLVPFAQLDEADRERNRVQVRRYPDLVRMAGWRLVRVADVVEEDL